MEISSEEEKENDGIFGTALELLDKGALPEDIIRKFPENREEVLDFIKIISDLKTAQKDIKPEESLLAEILKKLPATNAADNRFEYQRGKDYGRFPLGILTNTYSNMKNTLKILVPAAVLALIVGVFVLTKSNNSPGVSPLSNQPLQSNQVQTGTVSDITASLINDYAGENAIATEDSAAELNLITADKNNINLFGDIFNENEY
ncbi:MAG: hypothetical protein CEN90_185 [Parcubacteria group bacterium Licking1014_17]|nr:MAG: hypothetical protein CEN90_185 [Parcubacteria group bacterium Licking1014_17]